MREPVKDQAQIQSSSLKLSNLYKYGFRCIVYFPGNNYLKIFFFVFATGSVKRHK